MEMGCGHGDEGRAGGDTEGKGAVGASSGKEMVNLVDEDNLCSILYNKSGERGRMFIWTEKKL